MYSTSPIKIKTQLLASIDPRFSVTHRQELIAGFNQQKLTNARAILIGAGGIGSEVGEGLCRKGIGNLAIFDHDVVEHTNLNRQHFFAQDIGKNKGVQLARNLALHCHAGTVIEGHPLSFQDALALEMDMSASVAICGVDNGEARIAASEHYRSLGVPVIFIAVDLLAECGYVFVQENLAGSACFGCAFPNTLHGRKAPCFVPSAKDILKATAGFALYAVDSLLMERNRNWNYRRIHLAGFAPGEELIIERNSKCPLCYSKEQGSPAGATEESRALPGGSPDPFQK